MVAGHVLPGLNGHGQQAPSSAAAFVEESNPPKIRVVVRKRPLNSKVRVGAYLCAAACTHTDGPYTYVSFLL